MFKVSSIMGEIKPFMLNKQSNNLKIFLNTILVIFETIALLSFSLILPAFFDTYNLIWDYDILFELGIIIFVIMAYISFRLFAKKSLVAWIGGITCWIIYILYLFMLYGPP